MLSGVLNSGRAIQINIQIMRIFVKLRHMVSISEDLKRELSELRKITDQRFQIVFEALDQILQEEEHREKQIGFTVKECVEKYNREIIGKFYDSMLFYQTRLRCGGCHAKKSENRCTRRTASYDHSRGRAPKNISIRL